MLSPSIACCCTLYSKSDAFTWHVCPLSSKSSRSHSQYVKTFGSIFRGINVAAVPRGAFFAGTCCGCSLCKSGTSAGRWGWYDKYFAYSMAYGMQEYEHTMAVRKDALFAQLFAQPVKSLLEVGIGTGANNRYYMGQQVNGLLVM